MSWDVSTAWEASAAAEWERICEASDRYHRKVKAAVEAVEDEVQRYRRISGMLDDGYDYDTDEDLTEAQRRELETELESLEDYINSECDCNEVEREIVWRY